ncbi:MAG: hypothetical protein K2X81_20040 [Candidatus Obscuribacterales bacterium]|nr:hypothetical protein [Candidatus Obscuribacterales bacterium]
MFNPNKTGSATLVLLKMLSSCFLALTSQFNEKSNDLGNLYLVANMPTGIDSSEKFRWLPDYRMIVANAYWAVSVRAVDKVVSIYLIPAVYLLVIAKYENRDHLRFEIKVSGNSDDLKLTVDNSRISLSEIDTLCLTIFNDLLKRSNLASSTNFAETRLKVGEHSLSSSLRDLWKERHNLIHELLRQSDQIQGHIARELHDEIISDLLVLKAMLVRVSENRDATDIIDNVVRKTRSICSELHCRDLEDWGLELALRNLLDGFEERSKLKTQLEIVGSYEALPSLVELQIYRIIQESVTNVIKHAEATQVIVQLNFSTPKGIQIRIKDNGKGIGSSEFASTSGSGRKIMMERVEMISTIYPARISFENSIPAGLSVNLDIDFQNG